MGVLLEWLNIPAHDASHDACLVHTFSTGAASVFCCFCVLGKLEG